MINSFLSRAAYVVKAFDKNKGQDISPEKLLPTLLGDLQKLLGDPVHQPDFKFHAGGKLHSRVFAVPPNKHVGVAALLSELDFSVTKIPSSGYLGGVRMETNRKVTVVNYCQLSGVLVVSTNLSKEF